MAAVRWLRHFECRIDSGSGAVGAEGRMGKTLFSGLCFSDEWDLFDSADCLGIGNILFQWSGDQGTCGLCSVDRGAVSLYPCGTDSRHCAVGARAGSCDGQYNCEKNSTLNQFSEKLEKHDTPQATAVKLAQLGEGDARGAGCNVINLKQPLNGRQNVWKYQKGEGKSDSDGREKDVG